MRLDASPDIMREGHRALAFNAGSVGADLSSDLSIDKQIKIHDLLAEINNKYDLVDSMHIVESGNDYKKARLRSIEPL